MNQNKSPEPNVFQQNTIYHNNDGTKQKPIQKLSKNANPNYHNYDDQQQHSQNEPRIKFVHPNLNFNSRQIPNKSHQANKIDSTTKRQRNANKIDSTAKHQRNTIKNDSKSGKEHNYIDYTNTFQMANNQVPISPLQNSTKTGTNNIKKGQLRSNHNANQPKKSPNYQEKLHNKFKTRAECIENVSEKQNFRNGDKKSNNNEEKEKEGKINVFSNIKSSNVYLEEEEEAKESINNEEENEIKVIFQSNSIQNNSDDDDDFMPPTMVFSDSYKKRMEKKRKNNRSDFDEEDVEFSKIKNSNVYHEEKEKEKESSNNDEDNETDAIFQPNLIQNNSDSDDDFMPPTMVFSESYKKRMEKKRKNNESDLNIKNSNVYFEEEEEEKESSNNEEENVIKAIFQSNSNQNNSDSDDDIMPPTMVFSESYKRRRGMINDLFNVKENNDSFEEEEEEEIPESAPCSDDECENNDDFSSRVRKQKQKRAKTKESKHTGNHQQDNEINAPPNRKQSDTKSRRKINKNGNNFCDKNDQLKTAMNEEEKEENIHIPVYISDKILHSYETQSDEEEEETTKTITVKNRLKSKNDSENEGFIFIVPKSFENIFITPPHEQNHPHKLQATDMKENDNENDKQITDETNPTKFSGNKTKIDKKQKVPLLSELIVDYDEYEVVSQIGKGSFGSVFLVIEKKSGIEYAMKIISFDIKDRNMEGQILREIEMMNLVEHRSICHIRGFSLLGTKKPFIIMDFYRNGSLEDVILNKPDFDQGKKIEILYQIAVAMSYLHSKNIIHRDLKPANILLDDDYLPVICDFGFSKMIFTESFCEPKGMGTLLYMAPEILKNREYGKFVDVYAYSIICFELLTGNSPFNTKVDTKKFISSVCSGKRPSLNKYRNNVLPKEMKELISRGWDCDPHKRPTFLEIIELFKNEIFNQRRNKNNKK